MNLPHQIKTIDEFNESIFTTKKSNFIAQVYSAISEDETKECLLRSKKKYFDASHHCYAYKFAEGSNRYSDAGEPSGTAGIRILNAIEHFELLNQLVIVTRFFGGVKLGVGALGKAYYLVAHKALNNSKIITKQLFQKVDISAEFEHFYLVHQILTKYKSIILNTEYQNDTKFSCLVKYSNTDLISKILVESSNNKIIFTPCSEFVYK
jgi:uncharacterized YigZ family protein